jgi:hypothetical protein
MEIFTPPPFVKFTNKTIVLKQNNRILKQSTLCVF